MIGLIIDEANATDHKSMLSSSKDEYDEEISRVSSLLIYLVVMVWAHAIKLFIISKSLPLFEQC
jgi:hypothetical protein